MKLIIVLLISILLSGCWAIPEPPPEPNVTVYRALLVGIGDFLHINDLTSPPYNVDRMRTLFNDCKFSETEFLVIDELKDTDATKEAVLGGIASTFADADDNDISYFYWCGHGGTQNEIPVICPTDWNFTLASSITVDELEIVLSAIPGTKVVILEACHSGNFIERSIGSFNDKVIEIFSQSKGINKDSFKVITSCRGHQVCWEHDTYTYFTKAFLKGCGNLTADENEDEIVDLAEIHEYIIEWIEEYCSKNQDTQLYPNGSTFPIVEY